MSRQKDKGTKFESAVVQYLRSRGFEARRQALAGNADEGDVLVESPLMDIAVECKDRKSMSPKWLGELLDEAESEAINAKASYGVAIVHRDGCGKASFGGQAVLMSLDTFADLMRLAGL